MYSFLLDSESGYNLDSAENKEFYGGRPSYLYWLLKNFYPDTTRTTVDNIKGKLIYEIVVFEAFKWNLYDKDKNIFDTINKVQPTLLGMMKDNKAILHIDLTWEASPITLMIHGVTKTILKINLKLLFFLCSFLFIIVL